LIFETEKQFFNSDNLQIDLFKTIDKPNSRHIAQDPQFDRMPTLKFMLYENDISFDNGAFELSPSTHHWVKKLFLYQGLYLMILNILKRLENYLNP
tara:strand:+ start:206 stop:493 length:288 start_codon:yes stop_codon:yes gene_type:complete